METASSLTFATLLRRYRVATGLSQKELAERAGLSVRTIGDLERGASKAPRKDTVALLAQALALAVPERAALTEAARRLSTASSRPAPDVPSSPALVGRRRELALLEQHLGGQGPPVLLLAGEPGIGKTRLLHAALPRAVAQGLRVLEGGCQRRGGHAPYAPLLGALQRHICHQAPAQQCMELAGCAWLVRLLPELAAGPIEPLPAWTLPPEQERRLMVQAVLRFLGNVAGPAGTLLVLDDLQWASPDALELLTVLVRSASEIPLRMIGAYRDTEVGPHDPLSVMLADLAQAELATQHTLGPLTPEEAGQLLAGLLVDVTGAEPLLQQRVLQRAGGLPFFLVSCAQALRTVGEEDGAAERVPWDVAQGLRQRVAGLSAAAQEVLGVAAVVGRVVAPALLTEAAAQGEEDVLAACEAACRARLLEEAGAEGYQFAHDVIREVVEADLGAARRMVLHRRVAEALEGQPGAALPETLAYHYEQSAVWTKALDYLVQAGDKAMAAYAHRDALEFYARADGVCARVGEVALPTRIVVAQKRGFGHFALLDWAGASAAFTEMGEAACRLGDRRLYGMALVYRGGLAEIPARAFEAAEATLGAALAVAAEGFDDVRLAASLWLNHMYLILNRHAEAAALLRTAAAWVPTVTDPESRSLYGGQVAVSANWTGHFDEAIAALEQWRDAAVETHRIPPQLLYQWLEGVVRGGKGEYQQAVRLLEGALAGNERAGDLFGVGRCLNTLGWIHGELQDHRRAAELNTRGVTAALTAAQELNAPDAEVESNARLNLGDSLLALGRLEEAEAQFRLVEQIVRNPPPQDRCMLWRYAQHLFHSYGELWLARGEHDTALAYADECLEVAAASASTKNIVKARRLRAQVFLAQGKRVEAEQEIAEALEMARQIGNPPQLWKTYVTLGDLRLAQGRPQDARQSYHAALAIIDGVAAALTDAALRETFLTSAHVQHIRQMARACATLPNAPPSDATVPARPSLPARHGVVPGASLPARHVVVPGA
jgi:tetratricopeptide (TPR) repeat protein/transcriptional regulator with XRE-family HTH domain